MINRLHSLLDKYDVNCISCSHLFGKKGIKWVKTLQLVMSEIGDISRFGNPNKLISWSGLCPTLHQYGNSLYIGRMKDGNKKYDGY